MESIIKIHRSDNVAVSVSGLKSGQILAFGEKEIKIHEAIPPGHKLALIDIPKGQTIIKYGAPIGCATEDISQGHWIHTHNLKTMLGEIKDYQYHPDIHAFEKKETSFFMGYRRNDGKVGIRNQIWIIPTVGCVNHVATKLAALVNPKRPPEVDELLAFPHPYGCSQMGEDQENTRKILTDLILHPNAAAVLVVGLGCENSGISVLKEYMGEYDRQRVFFLSCQDEEDEIQEGRELLHRAMIYAKSFKRESIPASELVVGLKCGGSDGFSGITANPAVGRFSDLLISCGGSTILTEVPEMFGAETILMNRCIDENIFQKTVRLINDFKEYFLAADQIIYDNPSPGNKEGGISSLEEKALGCTQKSGDAPVVDVVSYAEKITVRGLNLLSAPGNDLVASTALAASGAHMVLFTTGRGTPFACPVPTAKISSNSLLAQKKANWIDYDAGVILDGISAEESGRQIFEQVLSIASGQKVKSEIFGFTDMAIFKNGVTL